MKKHKFRIALSVNFIILTLILLCCCTKLSYGGAAQVKATGEFSVTALNIGKADSLILKTQNHTVLTDCGEKGDSDDIISALAESGVSEIDCLIITHFDKDHVGGAAKLIKKISVNQIITPNYRSDSEEYKDFIAAAEENNLTPITLTENLSFVYDDVTFEVYPPESHSMQRVTMIILWLSARFTVKTAFSLPETPRKHGLRNLKISFLLRTHF